MKGYLNVKELESYKKADIQNLARNLGVSDAGTIKEIAARCAAVEIETGEGAPQTGQETTEEYKAVEITSGAEKAQEEAGKAAGGVKVEVVARYLDQQFNQIKDVGEIFTVDWARAEVLLAEKVVKIKE